MESQSRKELILVTDETSGRILGALLVPSKWSEHEFNRLIDHFQLGADDWDIVTPITHTFTIRIKPVSSVVDRVVTIQAPSHSRFLS